MYRWPTGFLIRDVLTKATTYKQAVNRLSNSPLISPCYFTVAGVDVNQGCVLVRDHDKLVSKQLLGDQDPKHRYLCQTNHDHGDDNAENIIYSYERTREVRNLMQDEKNLSSPSHLLSSINSFPLINEETIYTCQMIPSIGSITTVVNREKETIH
ncbi:hypothetical protein YASMINEVIRUS_1411 [Yasminevirus sp. GU-2018]|uniref:Peptidase C45 hydrolase domain-containing protein n=1 Tax=Yasminevirus sp. GU-2018 TaxID=2420051 RepID=A0A5K0U9W9_9VIRU|nr:hypothetical protein YASMINEVIRUS_1411 [Yasminevirus sp. GU-2018]